MFGEDRGTAMAASLVRTARSCGISPDDITLLSRAHALAMQPRVAAFDDDHHPQFLHPGRTVLVLLNDAGVTDPVLLAGAALVESEDQGLRVDVGGCGDELPQGVQDLVAAVPLSRAESLAERLVTASEAVRLAALAERLDHLRHAHLRDDMEWRRRVHDEAVNVYLPIAQRTHDKFAGRYGHWCRTFARRFLG